MMKLYYATGTCALATHIALIDAGADYETVRLSFASEDQRKPEYLLLNPKARVPTLVTDEGNLTETPALLAYVAQKYPQAKLAPLGNPFEFARVQAFNSYLCSTVHVAHSHRMRGYRWADEPEAIAAMQRKVPASVSACFELIDREMIQGPWVMGDTYTICDPYLFTLSQWLEADGVDMAKIPNVRAHRERNAARPNVQRALAEQFAQ
ncbi:glutathione S-transferase [Afipia sp. Root123D2]|uniref:glutathione S-transferase family protein n=1 Tax=Afipia sp. Root123D2 TaxID=1736436 RepID=UPI0006F5B400|nr:glutathione S-transferase N-terminal domain-containing protein [Afipia sp. Root123D2]KQW22523.1 glutathione S-transferase [Afipia sp. Root123D2]